jgi:hypothetical protein
MVMNEYTLLVDLAKEVQPPDKGILSRTLFNDDRLKAVIFGFGQGEELSEHTASMPAILQFIQGEATVTLGDDKHEAKHPGEDAGGHAVAVDERASLLKARRRGGDLNAWAEERSAGARRSRFP